MLKLDGQTCELIHVNIHREFEGDKQTGQGLDLKWKVQLPPSVLDAIVPEMREHFFKPSNSSGAMAGELQLRCPDLKNDFEVERDIPGYHLAIEVGAVSGNILEYGGVELGKMRVKLINGGAVELTFRTQVHATPEEHAKAVPLLGLKLPLTLSPPDQEPLPKSHPDSEESRKAAQKAIDKAKGIGKASNAETGAAAAGNGAEPDPAATGPIGSVPPTEDGLKGSDLADGATPPDPAASKSVLDKLSDDARKAASKPLSTRPPKPGVH